MESAPPPSPWQPPPRLDPKLDNLLNFLSVVLGSAFCYWMDFIGETHHANRDSQIVVSTTFYVIVAFVLVVTALLKLLDLLGLLRHLGFLGLREGDSLCLYRVILQARFLDLIQGNGKNPHYALAIWTAILSVAVWYLCESTMYSIPMPLPLNTTSANLTALVITSVKCSALSQGGSAGGSSSSSGAAGGAPICVNLTCPTSSADPAGTLRAGDPSCSMLPPSLPGVPVSVAAPFTCTVAVALRDKAGELIPLVTKAQVEAGLVNDAFFDGRWEWNATGLFNASFASVDVLAETDSRAVATYSVNLGAVAGQTGTHRFRFSTISSPPAYSEPVQVLNDVKAVFWSFLGGPPAELDGGRAFYQLDASDGPNIEISLKVSTRFNQFADRFDCDRNWTGADTSVLHGRCTSACHRCRVQTSLCAQPAFECTATVLGAKPVCETNDASAAAGTTETFCGAGTDELSCLQDGGGASDRDVSFVVWHFVWNTTVFSQAFMERHFLDGYLTERRAFKDAATFRFKVDKRIFSNKSLDEVLSDSSAGSWQRADMIQPLLVHDRIETFNGTERVVARPTVPVQASGVRTAGVYFDNRATQKGLYRVQAVSQGVASAWESSPLIFIMSLASGSQDSGACGTIDSFVGLVPEHSRWLLRFHATWIFLAVLISVPIIYFNREEVTMAQLCEDRQIILVVFIVFISFFGVIITYGFESLIQAKVTSFLAGCDINYSWYHFASGLFTMLALLWAVVTGYCAFFLSTDEVDPSKRKMVCYCCKKSLYVSKRRQRSAIILAKALLTNLKIRERSASSETMSTPGAMARSCFPTAKPRDMSPAMLALSKQQVFERMTEQLQPYPPRLWLSFYLSLMLAFFAYVYVLWLVEYSATFVDIWFVQLYDGYGYAQRNVTLLLETAAALEYQKNLQQKASGDAPEGFPPMKFSDIRGIRGFQEEARVLFQNHMTVDNMVALQSDLILFGTLGATCGIVHILWMWLSPWGIFVTYQANMVTLRRGGKLRDKIKVAGLGGASLFPAFQAFHCLAGFILITLFWGLTSWVLFSDFTRDWVWNQIFVLLATLLSVNLVVKQLAKLVSENFLTFRTRKDDLQIIRHRRMYENVDTLLSLFSYVTATALTACRFIIVTLLNFGSMIRLDQRQDTVMGIADNGYGSYCSMLYTDYTFNNGLMNLFWVHLKESASKGAAFRQHVERILASEGLLAAPSSDTKLDFAGCISQKELRQVVFNKCARQQNIRHVMKDAATTGVMSWSRVRQKIMSDDRSEGSDENHVLAGSDENPLLAQSNVTQVVDAASLMGSCARTSCAGYQGILPYDCQCGAAYQDHDVRGGLVARCLQDRTYLPIAFYSSGSVSVLKWWLWVYLHKLPVLRHARVHRDRMCDVVIETDGVQMFSQSRKWERYHCWIERGSFVFQLESSRRLDKSVMQSVDLTRIVEDLSTIQALIPCVDTMSHDEGAVQIFSDESQDDCVKWNGQDFRAQWIKRPSSSSLPTASSEGRTVLISDVQKSDSSGGSTGGGGDEDDEDDDGNAFASTGRQSNSDSNQVEMTTLDKQMHAVTLAAWQGKVTLADGSSFKNPRNWLCSPKPAVHIIAGSVNKPTQHSLRLGFDHVVTPHAVSIGGRKRLTMCFETLELCQRFSSIIEQCWKIERMIVDANCHFGRPDVGVEGAFIAGMKANELIRVKTWSHMLIGVAPMGQPQSEPFVHGSSYTLLSLDSVSNTARLADVANRSLVMSVQIITVDNMWEFYTDVLEGSHIYDLQHGIGPKK